MRRACSQPQPLDRQTAIKAIHTLARDLHMNSDTRKSLQQRLVGVDSCAAMTVAQLRTVHACLAVLANDAGLGRQGRFEAARNREKKRPGRDERKPLEQPTKEQLDKIQHLCEHVGLHGVAYIQFCRRTTRSAEARDGHPFPQTRHEANQVIEALKQMEARGWRATGAPVGGTA